jgi:hypothetical protein
LYKNVGDANFISSKFSPLDAGVFLVQLIMSKMQTMNLPENSTLKEQVRSKTQRGSQAAYGLWSASFIQFSMGKIQIRPAGADIPKNFSFKNQYIHKLILVYIW